MSKETFRIEASVSMPPDMARDVRERYEKDIDADFLSALVKLFSTIPAGSYRILDKAQDLVR